MISSGMDQAWIPVDNSRVDSFQEDGHNICIKYSHLDFSFRWIVYGFSHGIHHHLGEAWQTNQPDGVVEFFQPVFQTKHRQKQAKSKDLKKMSIVEKGCRFVPSVRWSFNLRRRWHRISIHRIPVGFEDQWNCYQNCNPVIPIYSICKCCSILELVLLLMDKTLLSGWDA